MYPTRGFAGPAPVAYFVLFDFTLFTCETLMLLFSPLLKRKSKLSRRGNAPKDADEISPLLALPLLVALNLLLTAQ